MKIVHIGFPKTATTFLQEQILPQLSEDFNVLTYQDSMQLLSPIMDYDDAFLDLDSLRESVERQCPDGRTLFCSNEALTGIHHHSACVNRTLIAKRLKTLGFAKVIISIRNQYDILESSYRQYIKSGGVMGFDQYIRFDGSPGQFLYPEYFEYDRIYRTYVEIFGKENVLILQFEHLADDRYSEGLRQFLGVENQLADASIGINRSLSRNKTLLLRFLNHFTYSFYRQSTFIPRQFSSAMFFRLLSRLPDFTRPKRFMSSQKRDEVFSFYSVSNARFEVASGVRLDKCYPLENQRK